MKAVFRPMTEFPSTDNSVGRLTMRYRVAFDEYRGIVAKNTHLNLTGGKPSPQAQRDEERAFQELDSARQALLDAAAQADPTVH